MKESATLYASSPSKQLALTAMFAALCFIGTIVIVIPMPFGFFNLGDVFVLLAGWCLGPLYGGVAAAVGSSLADIVAGFPLYAPATFFIKGLDAIVAYLVWLLLKKVIRNDKLDVLPRAISALAGECVMAIGYFSYECLLYGVSGALAAVLGNVMQGLFGAVLGVALILCLVSIKPMNKLFPHLKKKKE